MGWWVFLYCKNTPGPTTTASMTAQASSPSLLSSCSIGPSKTGRTISWREANEEARAGERSEANVLSRFLHQGLLLFFCYSMFCFFPTRICFKYTWDKNKYGHYWTHHRKVRCFLWQNKALRSSHQKQNMEAVLARYETAIKVPTSTSRGFLFETTWAFERESCWHSLNKDQQACFSSSAVCGRTKHVSFSKVWKCQTKTI